jgi:hypothetical protein
MNQPTQALEHASVRQQWSSLPRPPIERLPVSRTVIGKENALDIGV